MIEEILFPTKSHGELPAILNVPVDADLIFVLGHGSGSTIHAPLMVVLSKALGDFGIATLRFEYPYSCHPDFVPFTDMATDDSSVLIETLRAALGFSQRKFPKLKTFVGGHSLSGLVTTYADAAVPLVTSGIISLGYPRKGDPDRSNHLKHTVAPILFVQGTNDALGGKAEIAEMVAPLGSRASLQWIEGADHGFNVDGRKLDQVAQEIAGVVHRFADSI